MKFMRFISRNFDSFISKYFNPNIKNNLIKKIVRYCTFETRNRKNFNEIFDFILRNILHFEKLT